MDTPRIPRDDAHALPVCACCGDPIADGGHTYHDTPGLYCLLCDVPPGFQPLYGSFAVKRVITPTKCNCPYCAPPDYTAVIREADATLEEARRVIVNALGITGHATVRRIDRARAALTNQSPVSALSATPNSTANSQGRDAVSAADAGGCL